MVNCDIGKAAMRLYPETKGNLFEATFEYKQRMNWKNQHLMFYGIF